MELFIIAIVSPLIIAVTAYFLVKHFVENDQKKRILELKYDAKNHTLPMRLQAYERMAMFLERIEPNQLIFRVNNPELTAYQMQTILLSTIRSEYEHNLSQQIYISSDVWDAIKHAKEMVVNIINLSAGKLPDGAMANDLYINIFEAISNQSPTANAMQLLKKEVALLYQTFIQYIYKTTSYFWKWSFFIFFVVVKIKIYQIFVVNMFLITHVKMLKYKKIKIC